MGPWRQRLQLAVTGLFFLSMLATVVLAFSYAVRGVKIEFNKVQELGGDILGVTTLGTTQYNYPQKPSEVASLEPQAEPELRYQLYNIPSDYNINSLTDKPSAFTEVTATQIIEIEIPVIALIAKVGEGTNFKHYAGDAGILLYCESGCPSASELIVGDIFVIKSADTEYYYKLEQKTESSAVDLAAAASSNKRQQLKLVLQGTNKIYTLLARQL